MRSNFINQLQFPELSPKIKTQLQRAGNNECRPKWQLPNPSDYESLLKSLSQMPSFLKSYLDKVRSKGTSYY